ncbi:hypothetical protein DRE_00165 [Drechslerella stenobrocha 248]|uniref:Uncharacterized protein n=1 Tax=Drechslerella stenobrocha 248 TaxID=1043628 RepID=W7IHU7_9PEZI|nr:hypothetical protein DRE_00165 [Drechslerella stenobrocha 248]
MQTATRRPAAKALCLFCSFRRIHSPASRRLPFAPRWRLTPRPIRASPTQLVRPPLHGIRYQSSKTSKAGPIPPAPTSLYSSDDTKSYDQLFDAINEKLFLQTVGESPKIPRETEVILAFKALQRLAASSPPTKLQDSKTPKSNPNDAILSLTGRPGSNGATNQNLDTSFLEPVQQSEETIEAEKAAKLNAPVSPIMDMAYHIAIHPYTFISPRVLTEYIKLAAILKDPSTLPSIFKLYANKPVLHDVSKPAKKPFPNAPNNAIPYDCAKAGLQVAIAAKNMPLALEIIDNSVSTRAWCRRKLVTKLLPFTATIGAIPIGLYKIADWIAQFQEQWLHEKAMTYAFLGFMTYYICTGSLGLIALLTWNDHMIRVNWIPGVYLRERWFMEEQRALTDRVAMAWGYQEPYKRGLESGWEWEMLRHWAGVKGMIIDSSEMVEGRELTSEKEAERLAAQDSFLARLKLKLAKPEDKKTKKRLFPS